MTPEEKKAVSVLRRAIRNAHKLGIRLAGMDGSLLYATKSAFQKAKAKSEMESSTHGGGYSVVATACQFVESDDCGVLDNKCYEDSGGY